MIIHYKDAIYKIEELPYENQNINLDRSYTIIRLLEKDYDWDKAILFSNYYTNYKYHGCIYDEKIMSILKEF